MKNVLFILFMSIVCLMQSIAQTKATFKIKKTNAVSGQTYETFTFDGAWCWFSDPRAIYANGKTYAGWVNSYGDIQVGQLNNSTGDIKISTLHRFLNKDDHANPSLMFLPNGKLVVFYSKHSTCCGGVGPFEMFYRISKNPYDATAWEDEMITGQNTEGWAAYCYSNPALLSSESDKMYVFWRGGNYRPNYTVSTDLGKTWDPAKTLINHKEDIKGVRPYVKMSNNGKDKIHVAFTDGHPRNEAENSIYYMYLKDGVLHKANGEKIADLDDAPVAPAQTSVVYNAKETKNKAWIWDITEDAEGKPVLVYAVFPTDTSHYYYYSKWSGTEWITHELVNSGAWFPKTTEGKVEPEPNYSGGIVLDHENPSIVYLSRKINGVFEIEKWETKNDGKSWSVYPITKDSEQDNIRPFAIRGAGEESEYQVLWMNNQHYRHFVDYHTSIRFEKKQVEASDALTREDILKTVKKVADWQLAYPRKRSEFRWHYGAFYTGIQALYETTNDVKYQDEMISMASAKDYKLIADFYHADRLAIAQPIIDIYKEKKDPAMIRYIQYAMDSHLARHAKADVSFDGNQYYGEWWSWCDALYMAPPAFAKMTSATGDFKYLNYADKHWWITSDYLYSPEDSLYFRDDRYFEKKTANGEKVFWSRGNGWVIGGLVHMLEEMPDTFASKPKFEQQYKEMAAKIASLQGEDGLWGVSLLDRAEFPIGETSGSSFYCYALAWGINNGYLDKEIYQPKVEAAWKALVANVQITGLLGYVQQVAADPYETLPEHWEVYGSGAFILAGTEIMKMID